MRRLTCCISLLTFLLAHSHSAVEPRTAWPLTTHVTAADAALAQDGVPLPFDTPLSGSLPPRSSASCSLGETQYIVQYPGGATRVKIEVTTASSQIASGLITYARFGQRVTSDNGRVTADFVIGAVVPLYFPTSGPHLFEAGTYFIALVNCGSEQVDFTIRATLLMPTDADTATVTPETAFGAIPPATPGSCSLSPTQYRVMGFGVGPCGGTLVSLSARSDQDITLYVRRDQRVAVEDGQIVADFVLRSPGPGQAIDLTSRGTYFFAVGNCSAATANYIVFATQVAIDFFGGALVNGCGLSREPNGAFVLAVVGANIKEGATVTVGGATPKKVKFVELEAGSTNSYRLIRVVKKFCGRLPGNIVVTNPGPCSVPSAAFFCNERCPE
ncbi:MAG TPA: hypothetical protein VJZ91_15840 [Blastocatellia bacterium]|nr:hypothetical protein [Blastocatellia bacterium]